MTKRCRKCNVVKDADEFHKNNHHKDGLTSYCKKCCRERGRQYAKTKKGKESANKAAKKWQRGKGREASRKYQRSLKRKNCVLRWKFGMTLEQYDEMFKQQNGVCAICGMADVTGRRLAVDHNHETKKIRGLLCTGCNTRLGILEHKIWRTLAEKYLYDHSD